MDFLAAGIKKKRGRCREMDVSGGSTIVKNGEINVYKAATFKRGLGHLLAVPTRAVLPLILLLLNRPFIHSSLALFPKKGK